MAMKSSKNELQEYCDGMQWEHPRYQLIRESPNFVVRVEVLRGNQDLVSAEGEHSRKKEAGKVAARILLDKLMSASPDAQTSEGAGSGPNDQDQNECMEGASPFNSPWNSPPPKTAKSFINYRSQLHQYCQQNNLIVSYDEVDSVQIVKRFSTKLTIDGNPSTTVGSGDSKNEAKEEAARLMWDILKKQDQEKISTKENFDAQNPPKILYKHPVTIGIQDFRYLPPLNLDSNSNEDGSDNDFNSPPNLNNLNIDIDDDSSESSIPPDGDYIQALKDKFENTDNLITYIPIPLEEVVHEHFYFVSVGVQGDIPIVAGHGKGLSEEEAKNAAAKDCLELYIDPVTNKKFTDYINKIKFN